jgi:hypothetical protein
VTEDQAQQIWASMQDEIEDRLLDIRPKLKSFEAYLIKRKCREAIIALFKTTDDAGVIRRAVRAVFDDFKYRKRSRFA